MLVAMAMLVMAGCSATPASGTVGNSISASTQASVKLDSAADAWSQRVHDVKVRSKALKRSVAVRVVLPAPAASAPAGGWPVVYLLHGSGGNSLNWMGIGADVYRLSAASRVIVVMPDGGAAGYYSNWNKGPKWETFHLTELRAYVKAHFRANTRREAIGGFSMGGFGALSYAARHPGRFKAVMALSPVANPLRDPNIVLEDLRWAYSAKSQYKLWGSPKKKASIKTWKKHDPYYLAKGLRNTSLYLYAGKNGGSLESSLRSQTIKLAKKLKKLKLSKLHIKLILRTNANGTHAGQYWASQLTKAWPHLSAALKK